MPEDVPDETPDNIQHDLPEDVPGEPYSTLVMPGFITYIPGPSPISDRVYTPSSSRDDDDDTWDSPSDGQPERTNVQAANLPDDPRIFRAGLLIPMPLVVEVLLSLCLGIYGVGWLLAGKIMTGVLLFIGSFLFYLPLFVVTLIFAFNTRGVSLLYTIPFMLGAVLINALILKRKLTRTPPLYKGRY